MPASDQRVFSLSSVAENAAACGDSAGKVLRSPTEVEKSKAAWRIVNDKLTDWERNAAEFDDDGVTPPSPEVVRVAIQLAQALEKARFPAPDCIIPDANGGIVFERRSGEAADVYHVWDDERIEYQRFHGTTLVERRTL